MVEYEKEVPADIQAIKFWLINKKKVSGEKILAEGGR